MQSKPNTFLPVIQFVESLQGELEYEKKAHQAALRAIFKVSEANKLQKNEISERTTDLEVKLKEMSLKKEREMGKMRLQYTTELEQLNEDFATLAKSTTAGKRKPQDTAASDRLISISKTLNNRNKIITSLEDALERMSIDKGRCLRECDFLRQKVEILEAQCLPADFHKEGSTTALEHPQETTCRSRNGITSSKDLTSWMQSFLDNCPSPTAVSSMCASHGCKCKRSDGFEIQFDYFGCDSVNVPPAIVNASENLPPHERVFPQELAHFHRRAELELECSIARSHDDDISKSPEETKAEANLSVEKQADAAPMGEKENLMSGSEQELLLRCKSLEEELSERMAVTCRLEKTKCKGPLHQSQYELINKLPQQDTSWSPEIEALESAPDKMEKEKINEQAKAAKQTAEWMSKEMGQLKLQNDAHEIRRAILERNRNMLEESVRQLEEELEEYRAKEQIIRSEKKDSPS